jgi:hypothetical protein
MDDAVGTASGRAAGEALGLGATPAQPANGIPRERVAIVAVHGVADQRAGQTVRELARLLCHGGDGSHGEPMYVQGRTQGVLVSVAPLRPRASAADTVPGGGARRSTPLPRPGGASRFHDSRLHALRTAPAAAEPDLGLAYTDYLLRRYTPAEHETLYESTLVSLTRRADGTPVDLVELYWADCSRLRPGGVRALSALYQLFFHLTTLARDLVDHAALATGHAPGLPLLQRLFAWTTWLLKLPAALLQLAMLLMLLFGTAALVPPEQRTQLLPAACIALAAGSLCLAALAWVRRRPATRGLDAATVAALAAAPAALLLAALAKLQPAWFDRLYFAGCALLVGTVGVLLVERYRRLVRDARVIGVPLMLAAVIALFVAHPEAWAGRLPLEERMVLAALRTGELLLAAMLGVWALIVALQSAAIVLSYRVGARHDAAIAQTLVTARLGTVASTALFAMLSLLLWAVLVALVEVALDGGPGYDPLLFGDGYLSAALFLQARLREVGALFMPLVALSTALAVLALVALAPGLREEVAPRRSAHSAMEAHDGLAAERLGRWWSWSRAAIIGRIARAVPLLAIAGAAVYLLFVGGVSWLDDNGERGAALLAIGQWLAGGAVTITALGARFTQTFGKLRVALDAVLDIDNYLRDPADGRSPRAAIFSRAAALLAALRARGCTRIVLVAHSQGTVICADLLHWLAQRAGPEAGTGARAPVALVTAGSPLRDLYAQRFPLLYRWMHPAPARFGATEAAPDPAHLGLAAWTNAYRSGDYVGRAIWRSSDDPALFTPASAGATDTAIDRAGRRAEFCLGSGAHTHYFTDDATALAAEIDRMVSAPLARVR